METSEKDEGSREAAVEIGGACKKESHSVSGFKEDVTTIVDNVVSAVDLLTNNFPYASHAFNVGYNDRRVIKERDKGGSGYSKNTLGIGSEDGPRFLITY